MSKYASLSERLAAHPGDEWHASFAELEGLLGFALPKAARSGRVWWANDPAKSHSRAWTAHGWEVGHVDHGAQHVVFRKGPIAASEVQPPALREAAETASTQMHATRALGTAALVAAGAGLVGALGALIVRLVRRK